MTTVIDLANESQNRAVDPTASVWVSASAGTGKTKVLTDRVLSLLLTGTKPNRLLCLTFTKAAAAEMSNRLLSILSKWTIAAETELREWVERLMNRPATETDLQTARQLFARVLDVPGGLHIETIHAFCQSLLKRFPVEAGVSPHFQVMDDTDGAALLADIQKQVLTKAATGEDSDLCQALGMLTDRVHETLFPDLIKALTDHRARIVRMIQCFGGVEGAIDALGSRLGLDRHDTVTSVLETAINEQNFDAAGLRRAIPILENGKVSDRKVAQALAGWLSLTAVQDRVLGFSDYSAAFLTSEGELRKTPVTKDIVTKHPHVAALIDAEAQRVHAIQQTLNALETRDASRALLTLGNAFLTAYRDHKNRTALLDYDDLIGKARDLLERQGISAWVLYKLDGGIDHVLIDEAQDTNPDQWAVIRALTLEFFSGIGGRDVVRTLFVVGDAKQSIYSFQRADPAEFASMRKYFHDKVIGANRHWDEVPLTVSFRSTQAVLDAVNAIFSPSAFARTGVAASEDDITHLPARQGQEGTVEVWPPIEVRPLDAPTPWKPPVERLRADQPTQRLAALIADRIGAMIGNQVLGSRGRPVQAGDILVLVRRRGPFVEDLIRALKARSIAVAGADRMVLTDQIAVMDLLALGAALLTPDDDLSLATVLKSPLLNLSEDDLFDLAWNRDGTLWDALRTSDRHGGTWDRLQRWQRACLRLSPYDFYSSVLGAECGRKHLAARLGPEAEEPLDEFLSLALAFQSSHPPSLQGFLHWVESTGVEIKRDLEQGAVNAVRIMTVHGSKGLQAPIVFLPDTVQTPKSPAVSLLWLDHNPHDLLAWPPKADRIDQVSARAKQAMSASRQQEYHRLLYVAATRAEDRLIVCGWQGRKTFSGNWYASVQDALAPIAARVQEPLPDRLDPARNAAILKLHSSQLASPDRPWIDPELGGALLSPLPAWAVALPDQEPSPPRPLCPSKPDGTDMPIRSPLDRTVSLSTFQRGTLIHRLLQTLPEIPRAARTQAAQRYLSKAAPDWESGQLVKLIAEVVNVLDHPEFKSLFGPSSLAEVPVAGLIGDRAIAGLVDRLAVTDTTVLIVDYKTNRRPPLADEPIPEQYVKQMAAYRLALACIYPRHKIRCLLLWTDGPILTELDSKLLDDTLM